MNLTELARLCGCTTSTVSKAFRNSPHLREETKQHILNTAREHGITVSTEQLLRGRCVLVLLPTFNNETSSRLLSNLQKKLMRLGLHMLAASWEYTPDSVKQLLRIARTVNDLCGILCYSAIEQQHIEALQTLHVPIIAVCHSHSIDCISYDVLGGYRQAVQHLIGHGRRRIGFIGETMTTVKEFCYRQAMAECGLQTDNRLIFRSALYSSAAGADGFSALFSLSEPPDAILCAYDYIALGVLNCAEAADIIVPHQLAVIGADNIKASSAYRLGLTTLAFDCDQIADIFIELLLHRIRNPLSPPQQITVPWNLIVRETG